MKKIERQKIKRLRKMSNGLGKDYYRIENFSCGKKENYEADIDRLLRDDKIHPIHIDLSKKYLLFAEVDSVIDPQQSSIFLRTVTVKRKIYH